MRYKIKIFIVASLILVFSGTVNSNVVMDGKNSFINITNDAGVVIASYVDSYSCDASYCIYQLWYAPSQIYAKNMSTGLIEFRGTNATSVINSANFIGSTYILNGIYTLTSPLQIYNPLIGQSYQNTILTLANGANSSIAYLNGDVYIKNIQFNGNRNNQIGTLEGLQASSFGSVTKATFKNVWIHDVPGSCIYILGTTGLINIDNNKLIDCVGGGGEGSIQLRDGSNAFISNNYITNTVPSINNSDGIFLNYFNSAIVVNNIISNGFHGIYGRNTNSNIISNNQVFNIQGAGIAFDSSGSFSNLVISNNRIYNTGEYAINIYPPNGQTANDITIANNQISNASWSMNTPAIQLYSATGITNVTISGNIINALTSTGIYLYGVTNTDINYNKVRNAVNGIIDDNSSIINANNTVFGNDLSNNITIKINGKSTGGVQYNNRGTSPYNFGNNATAPTAFGNFDTYGNTTSGNECYYWNSGWRQRMNTSNTTGC